MSTNPITLTTTLIDLAVIIMLIIALIDTRRLEERFNHKFEFLKKGIESMAKDFAEYKKEQRNLTSKVKELEYYAYRHKSHYGIKDDKVEQDKVKVGKQGK